MLGDCIMDMSDPKYVTEGHPQHLRHLAESKRREGATLFREAELLEAQAYEFESRVQDHEKWRAKKDAERDALEHILKENGESDG